MNRKNVIANRYEVIQHIGKGGMADVFLAVDLILNRQVAIKILHNDLSRDVTNIVRFEREAQAAAALAHPYIVEIYDVGEYKDHHFIVMEYLAGKTLKELIRQRAPLFLEEAIDLLKQLASAIATAHSKGIIHRDIKPQNVIVKSDGSIKVLDFGIAVAKGNLQLTRANNVMGSVHYLAPELAKGEAASPQSDIYALGVVFYEMLTGDVPFKAEQAVQIAMKHLREPVPSVRLKNPKIPQAVDNICLKAMAKDKNDRYQTCEELLLDLATCLEKKKVEPYVPSQPAVKLSKEKKKKTGILLFVGLLMVLLLSLSFLYIQQHSTVVMPSIVGLDVQSATKRLKEVGLEVDNSKTSFSLSKDYPSGEVFSASVEKGSQVKRGTKVSLAVSSGIGIPVEDYVGKNIAEVSEYFSKYPLVKVITKKQNSSEKPGTILSQEGLAPGTLFDPTVSNEIHFTYVAYPSLVIPESILGKTVDEAAKELEAKGIVVRRSNRDTSKMTQEELDKVQVGVVVDSDPKVGETYTQKESNYVTLFFY